MSNETLLALLSPILITIGGIASWLIKSRREDLIATEERARESRKEVYKILMDPFVAALTSTASQSERQKRINRLTSIEYKQAAFNLITFGSDEMIRSFNKLMDFFYHNELDKGNKAETIELLRVFTDFLLSIRKDLNTNKTKLKRSESIEFMLTDIKDYREAIDKK